MKKDGDGRGSEAKISVYPVTVYRERVNRYIKDYVGYVVDIFGRFGIMKVSTIFIYMT